MRKKIKSSTGRLYIMLMVFVTCILSFIVLYIIGRNEAISWENSKISIKFIMEIYTPLIGIIAAYYFGQDTSRFENSSTSLQTFIFSMFSLGLWLFCPPVIIFMSETIEGALRVLNSLRTYGETIAAGSVVFYFARSS